MNDDELIAAINHSKEPYIIVEGNDDVMVYRWILEEIDYDACLEPRGGCDGVKALINRKNEIKNPNVIFIIDKDTLVYSDKEDVPFHYENVIYTEGYSIENDLYQGKKFENVHFRKEDKTIFSKLMDAFLKYYACEVEKFRRNEKYDFTIAPESIVLNYSLSTSKLENYTEPSQETIKYLKNGYDRLLRGHSLFSLVRIVMGRQDRDVRYTQKQLYELCYRQKSESIKRMQEKIKCILLVSPFIDK